MDSRYKGKATEKGSEAMKIVDNHIEVTTEEASSGVTGNGVRYVLAISLLLAIIILSMIWIVPALMS